MTLIIKGAVFVSICGALYSPIIRYPMYMSSLNQIGPYTESSGKVELNFSAYSKEYKNDIVFDFFVVDEYDPSEYRPTSSTGEYFDINVGDVVNFSLTMDTSYFAKYNPCNFAIAATEYNTWYYNPIVYFKLWSYQDYTFDIADLREIGDFEAPYFYLNIKDNVVSYTTDTLNFAGFPIDLEMSTYDILDLSQFTFYYSSTELINGGTFSLVFFDTDNIFPYLNMGGLVNLSLTPVLVNKLTNEYTLEFANTFYVDPTTNQMSFTKRTGFEVADAFYLPIHGKDSFESYTLTLNIKDLGVNDINYYYNFQYAASKNLFGSCNDSQYCVVGGMK